VGLATTRTLFAHCLVENAVVHESIVEWTADRPLIGSGRAPLSSKCFGRADFH
jgi:hypothetical protein